MKKIVRSVLVLAAVALFSVVFLGAAGERRATVSAEALPCVEIGDSLVCFDGVPGPGMTCQRLSAHDVLCGPTPL